MAVILFLLFFLLPIRPDPPKCPPLMATSTPIYVDDSYMETSDGRRINSLRNTSMATITVITIQFGEKIVGYKPNPEAIEHNKKIHECRQLWGLEPTARPLRKK